MNFVRMTLEMNENIVVYQIITTMNHIRYLPKSLGHSANANKHVHMQVKCFISRIQNNEVYHANATTYIRFKFESNLELYGLNIHKTSYFLK